MRLREIKKEIEIYNDKNFFLVYGNSRIENIKKFKIVISAISHIGAFESLVTDIKNSELYNTSNNSLTGTSVLRLYSLSESLFNSISALYLTINTMEPKTTTESISIKMQDTEDFKNLLSSMSIIEKSLTQVITHEKILGELNINNWEHGSFWLDLSLKSVSAVLLVSSIFWSSAVISKKFTEDKILEEQLRSMKIKNDSLQDILEAQKESTNLLLDAEANYIYTTHIGGKVDNEYMERLKFSINNFVELIDKGVKVYPSLMATENVSNLFPDMNNIKSIESKIKKIEQKK